MIVRPSTADGRDHPPVQALSYPRFSRQRALLIAFFIMCAVGRVAFAQNSSQTNVTVYETQPAKHSPKKTASCPGSDPKSWGKIQEGENLLADLQPDKALAVCNEALQTKCTTLRDEAQTCARQAIEEKHVLTEVSQKLHDIDHYLARNSFEKVAGIESSLRGPDGRCQLTSELLPPYQSSVLRYCDLELKRRSLDPPPFPKVQEKLRTVWEYIHRSTALRPAGDFLLYVWKAIVWLAKWLSPAFLTIILLFYLFREAFSKKGFLQRERTTWIVWSVQDESKLGASGAVMEALNWESNPLLKDKGERLMCWLAPPFIPEKTAGRAAGSSYTTQVWRELLCEDKTDLLRVRRECTLWNNHDDLYRARINVRHFYLFPAYEELDVTLGKFSFKGLVGLSKWVNRKALEDLPSIIGVVTRRDGSGPGAWGVRLNANWKDDERRDQTVSVFAESQPQDFGDPLAQVAQRAALKLMLRLSGAYNVAYPDAEELRLKLIADLERLLKDAQVSGPPQEFAATLQNTLYAAKSEIALIQTPLPNANVVTAQAAFRQGIEMLRQLI
jgi:hypothetical protein